jgi:hypothetical protein
MEKETALKILTPLILAFPNSKAGKGTLDTYVKELMFMDEIELMVSVKKCMRTYDFLPSIAKVIGEAENMVQVARGNKHKSPDEAWNEVLKQMNDAFIYKKPVFSSPEIEIAALAMGWTGLCETATEDMGTIRAQFLKMYESVCKRKISEKIDNEVLEIMGSLGIDMKMIK